MYFTGEVDTSLYRLYANPEEQQAGWSEEANLPSTSQRKQGQKGVSEPFKGLHALWKPFFEDCGILSPEYREAIF